MNIIDLGYKATWNSRSGIPGNSPFAKFPREFL